MSGYIELFIGPMYSSKSTSILARAERLEHKKKKVLYVNHTFDTRYKKDAIATHSGIHKSALTASCISDIISDIMEHDVICIDEGQFFDDLYKCDIFATRHNKIFLIAALDGDFMRNPFKNVIELIPKCERVQKLSAICQKCTDDAAFTQKLNNNDD